MGTTGSRKKGGGIKRKSSGSESDPELLCLRGDFISDLNKIVYADYITDLASSEGDFLNNLAMFVLNDKRKGPVKVESDPGESEILRSLDALRCSQRRNVKFRRIISVKVEKQEKILTEWRRLASLRTHHVMLSPGRKSLLLNKRNKKDTFSLSESQSQPHSLRPKSRRNIGTMRTRKHYSRSHRSHRGHRLGRA
mmetsp:Transcript_3675/g.6837  ORF Transcript_3675/g.6837 Transcript_3675/m.6837 type:complete len:195 (+) Transcript_3675:269-853(+)